MANKPTPADFSPAVPDFPSIGQYQPIYGKFDLTTYVQGASDYEIIAFLVQCYNATLKGYSDVTQLSKDTVTAYNQLQTWVNTWFENVDIQKDIDTKLQQMYVDGTLAEAIGTSKAMVPAIDGYFNTANGENNLYKATSSKIDTLYADGTLSNVVKDTGKIEEAVDDYLKTVSGAEELSNATAKKIEQMAINGELGKVISETADVQSTTTDWLNTNVTPVGSAVVVDKSLSISGAAADAKAVGENIDDAKIGLENIYVNEYEVLARSPSDWEQGGYLQEYPYSKLDNEFSIRIAKRTNIPKGLYKITNKKNAPTPLRISIWVYNSSGTLIYNSEWKTGDFTFYVFEDGANYVASVSRVDGQKISLSYLRNVLNNYTFWRASTDHIDDGWAYGTTDNDGAYKYSNIRIILQNVPLEIGHGYEVTVKSPYQISGVSTTYAGVTYEEFYYGTKHTVYTRSSANSITFVVKNTAEDGYFMLGDIGLTIKDVGVHLFARDNILETGGITWKNASYDSDTGEEVVNQYSDTRALTSFIKVWGDSNLKIKTPANYLVELAAYDNNKNYLGTYQDYVVVNKEVEVLGFDGYIRALVKNSDSTVIDTNLAPFGIVISEIMGVTTNYYKNSTLSVMTHNLGAFGAGSSDGYDGDDYLAKLSEWVSTYKTYSPDFAGMQEFTPKFTKKANIDSRSDLFNKVFAKTISGMLSHAVAVNVNVVDANVKLLSTPDVINRRPFMHIIAEKNGVIFNILNVHLAPHNINARKAQAAELIKYMKTLDNFICTGDFNAATADEYDVYKAEDFNCANCGDFGVFNTYQFNDEPEDNIITSKNFKIESVTKGDKLTSDHFPLIAEIRILG